MDQVLTPLMAMQLAIDEAQKGLGRVAPNPPVGCVILHKEGYLIGKGYHQKYGGPHAEIEALNSITDFSLLEGATVYVTLEPCAHFGKTPPCSTRLAQLPIKKVVYGVSDPNPLVSEKGLEELKSKGIEIEKWSGPFQEQLEELVEIFLVNTLEKRTFVTLKVASTLDGQIADNSGQQRWITNLQVKEKVHLLRAQHDAVLIGRQTVEVDDPQLNVRSDQFPKHSNRVVILDPQNHLGKKLSQMSLSQVHKASEIIHVTVQQKMEKSHFECVGLAAQMKGSVIDLNQLMKQLYHLKIYSVLVEGGGITFSHFLQQKIVDRMYLFLSPQILGSSSGVSWTRHLSGFDLNQCLRMEKFQFEIMGDNIKLTGKINSLIHEKN